MPKTAVKTQREPQIIEMPQQKMEVVRSVGDPNVAGQEVLPALYGAVYTLKFDRKKQGDDFNVAPLRARWPTLAGTPKEEWVGLWALPIPEDTASLPEKVPGVEVRIETWAYGAVAQVLHVGQFTDEAPTVERLQRFIEESGYEIAGDHEEEYLTTPKASVQKVLIGYPVRRK